MLLNNHPNIGALVRGEHRLVLGEFNAHEAPTKINGTCNSLPQITIANGGLISSITWRILLILASDHLPLIISIKKPPDFTSVDNRIFVNFNRAYLVGFTD